MPIRVSFPAQFADLVGEAGPLEIEGQTVREVLEALGLRRPELAKLLWRASDHTAVHTPTSELNPMVVVFANGEDIRRQLGLATPVTDGDEVLLVSAVEGG